MAKKIPKNPRTQTEPRRGGLSTMNMFILLLVPWIVMGIVAFFLSKTDLPEYAVILISLGVALATTFAVGQNLRRLRARRR